MMRWRREPCPCCGETAEWLHGPAPDGPTLSRRGFLGAAAGLAAAAVAGPAFALPAGPERRLSIVRAQTSDRFSGAYWREGRYDGEALTRLNWLLRDPSMEEVTPMDPRLFDVLATVAQRLDADSAFEVISGYRAPETNAVNARRSRRVSRVSLHMSGMAADVRLPGRDSYGMARTAAEMQVGGVGLYRRSGFVHLDCGPARRW